MMGTLMLPMHVKLIPQYIMYNKLGWINTYLPLIIPSSWLRKVSLSFWWHSIWEACRKKLMKQPFVTAADNGSGLSALRYRYPCLLLLPLWYLLLSGPGMISFPRCFILQGLIIYGSSGAAQLVDATGNSSWGALFAMSTLSLLPLFFMFVFFQNYLVDGITAGSIKGWLDEADKMLL